MSAEEALATLREGCATKGLFTAGDGHRSVWLPSWEEITAALELLDARLEAAEADARQARTALERFADQSNWEVIETPSPYDLFEWDGGCDPMEFANDALRALGRA